MLVILQQSLSVFQSESFKGCILWSTGDKCTVVQRFGILFMWTFELCNHMGYKSPLGYVRAMNTVILRFHFWTRGNRRHEHTLTDFCTLYDCPFCERHLPTFCNAELNLGQKYILAASKRQTFLTRTFGARSRPIFYLSCPGTRRKTSPFLWVNLPYFSIQS